MKPTIPAALAALTVLAIPTAAHANRVVTADATCERLTFDMPRAETGTEVRVFRNGEPVHTTEAVTVFGSPVRFTLPSPDQSVTQSWRIEVDGPNDDQVFTDTQAPCVTPPTAAPTTSSTPTTTVPAATITTAPPVVAVTTPPVPAAPATTTTTVEPPRSPAPMLPATGGNTIPVSLAAVCAGAGLVLLRIARRGVRS
jgi:hypothetical protein